jgi:hypothetical protein
MEKKRIIYNEYQKLTGIPDKAKEDCTHLAYCVLHKIDFLLTWNCRHLGVPTYFHILDYNHKHDLWLPKKGVKEREQPGIHVRRVSGTTDAICTDYCQSFLSGNHSAFDRNDGVAWARQQLSIICGRFPVEDRYFHKAAVQYLLREIGLDAETIKVVRDKLGTCT